MPATRARRPAPLPLEPERLAALVARRAAARLGRVARALGPGPLARALPGARGVVEAARDTLARLPDGPRRRVLCGPDLRGFLGEFETWAGVRRLATGARGGPNAAARARLFDRVSRTEFLTALLPAGRIDRGFAGRPWRFARLRLRAAIDDLAALVLGMRLAHPGGPPLRLALAWREDPEQGRPADRIDLGTIAGPDGPLGIEARRGGSPRLVRRAAIPGTAIPLAPTVVSRPRRLRVGRQDRGAAPRFAAALRLVRLAWPEAHAMILRHTFLVVPVDEPGTVSWSLAARPGVSFINASGKTLVDLADDLVHESAHHRLHDLQEVRRLLRPGPGTEEVQAFDSPWRGTRRPLHGILHGCFTFLHRAALLSRILAALRARPAAVRPLLGGVRAGWIARQARRERRMIRASLRDLRRAARAGLLTAAGAGLLRALRDWAADPGGGDLRAFRNPPRAGRAAVPARARRRSRSGPRARRRGGRRGGRRREPRRARR